MLDTRAIDGWRRLRRSLTKQAAADDPAALLQLQAELAEAQAELAEVLAALAGESNKWDVQHQRPYSHGELARELGVSREAVSKRIRSRRG